MIWNIAIKLTNEEMTNSYVRTWNMAKNNNEKCEKQEIHNVGSGLWREN